MKIYKSVLSDEICDIIIEEGLKREQTEAGIDEDNKKSKGRSTTVSFLSNKTIDEFIRRYVKNANDGVFRIEDSEDLQFATYNVGDFYGWHKDSNRDNSRILSVTVQLSDPDSYEGGDIQIKDFIAERARGTIIVFNSNLLHRVHEVTAGTRYSLVQWYSGEPVR